MASPWVREIEQACYTGPVFNFRSKKGQRADLKELRQVAFNILVVPPAALLVLILVVAALAVVLGYSGIELIVVPLGALAGPVALMQIHVLLAIGLFLAIYFLPRREWVGASAYAPIIRLCARMLEFAGLWSSAASGSCRPLAAAGRSSSWLTDWNQPGSRRTSYLPGDSPPLE